MGYNDIIIYQKMYVDSNTFRLNLKGQCSLYSQVVSLTSTKWWSVFRLMMLRESLFIRAKTRNASKHLFVFKAVGFTYNCHNSSLKDRHICSVKHEICYFKKTHTWDQHALISSSLLLYFFTSLFIYLLAVFLHLLVSNTLAVIFSH